MMRSLTATASEDQPLGYFRIFARPPGGDRREITIFRDAPVLLENASFADPFTHQTASLALPQVTVWDNPGSGDLDWLVAYSDIDIVWQNVGSYEYKWRWEGYIASEDFGVSEGDSTYRIDLKGAFYGLDDYLAIPAFPRRPIPYEILIAQAFDQELHPTRLGQFRVLWPSWWNTVVPEYSDPKYLSYLKPWGVATGQKWTGFTSRSTGSWDPLLTGHVQSLLTVMYAEGGAQWSIRNRGYRRPELYLREIPEAESPDIIEVTLGAPGVEFTGRRDYTQRASVIYGQGVDEAGVSFSGLSVSGDGRTTTYQPFAYNPKNWPRIGNPNFDTNIKGKEVMIRFQDGVDQLSAQKIAQSQYMRFNEPGITGTITLKTDARFADGYLCPRMLITAGQTIRVKGLFGLPEGVLFHVTNASADFTSLTMTMEVDSKYRDELTVAEVKARTRDALTPLRALQVGKYSNLVQDLVLPWSTAEGSGCVPLGAAEFFNEKIPATSTFPYEDITRLYPPKNPASRGYYIKVNVSDMNDATNNWATISRDNQLYQTAIPIRMSQAGTIKLSQIAAYDKDGNVAKVRFHASVYLNSGIAPIDTPRIPDTTVPRLTPLGNVSNYQPGQPYPFFKDAWEKTREDGTQIDDASYWVSDNAGLLVGWGNYYTPAGYWPGRFTQGAERTGLLVDETPWSWSLGAEQQFDPTNPDNNRNTEYVGFLFVLIFCEEAINDPVYFMGRFIHQDPGTNS